MTTGPDPLALAEGEGTGPLEPAAPYGLDTRGRPKLAPPGPGTPRSRIHRFDLTPGLIPVPVDSALGQARAQGRRARGTPRPAPRAEPRPLTEQTRGAAARRARGKPTTDPSARNPQVPPEVRQTQVAMMAAARCSVEAIGRGLLLSQARVKGILNTVETRGMIEEFRGMVRSHALSESLDIAVKGMDWVNETIAQREPKAFDMVTRGLSNMEKVWASAAGETRPHGVQVAVINQPAAEAPATEIAALIALLTAPQ